MKLINCSSHRARDKVYQVLNANFLGYHNIKSRRYDNSKGMFILFEYEYDKVKDIKGVIKIKPIKDELSVCWSDNPAKDYEDARIRLDKLESEI